MKNLLLTAFVLASGTAALAESGEFDGGIQAPTHYMINFPSLPAVDVQCGAHMTPAYDMIKGWVCLTGMVGADGGSESSGEGSTGNGGSSNDNGGSEGGGNF